MATVTGDAATFRWGDTSSAWDMELAAGATVCMWLLLFSSCSGSRSCSRRHRSTTASMAKSMLFLLSSLEAVSSGEDLSPDFSDRHESFSGSLFEFELELELELELVEVDSDEDEDDEDDEEEEEEEDVGDGEGYEK